MKGRPEALAHEDLANIFQKIIDNPIFIITFVHY